MNLLWMDGRVWIVRGGDGNRWVEPYEFVKAASS